MVSSLQAAFDGREAELIPVEPTSAVVANLFGWDAFTDHGLDARGALRGDGSIAVTEDLLGVGAVPFAFGFLAGELIQTTSNFGIGDVVRFCDGAFEIPLDLAHVGDKKVSVVECLKDLDFLNWRNALGGYKGLQPTLVLGLFRHGTVDDDFTIGGLHLIGGYPC